MNLRALAHTTMGALLILPALVACSSSHRIRTTQFQAADVEMSVSDLRQQLATSAFLANRTESSPKLRIVPTRMQNASSDRISRVDQLAVVLRILHDPAMLELLQSKNVAVTTMPEQSWSAARYLRSPDDGVVISAASMPATDARSCYFNAEFSSITRAGAAASDGPAIDRTERFGVECSIVDPLSREVLWVGRTEFAREAHGLLAD